MDLSTLISTFACILVPILILIFIGLAWFYFSRSAKKKLPVQSIPSVDEPRPQEASIFEPAQTEEVLYPYFLRDDFLSFSELNFYLVLKSAVSDWAVICPKVSLGDLFYAKSSDLSAHRTLTNKIDRKHVDFLLCDPKTAKPILGIELDDKSHSQPVRQERDEFIQKVFAAAKLPLARVPVRRTYPVTELNNFLKDKALKFETDPVNLNVHNDPNQAPICPKCSSPMVLRTAKNGTNEGGQFWGCTQYPKCRGILKFEP